MAASPNMRKGSTRDFINILDNAMARVRMNNIAATRLIQQQVGLETIVHFTLRDHNLMAVQSDHIGAHAMDIPTGCATRCTSVVKRLESVFR
jgi:5,10-methylenetetrahydrofolate reductase